MNKSVLRAFIVVIFLAIVFFGYIRISTEMALQKRKPYISFSRMMMVASLCDDYDRRYGHWPVALLQLKQFHPELEDWAKDAWGHGNNVWGRELIFVPYNQGLGYGEIITYGRDGTPGGTGADSDLTVRFPVRANADWNNKVGEILKPRKN